MQSAALLLMFYISTLTHGVELDVPQFLHNFYLSSTGYKSITEIGLYGCARHCGMDSGCNSFTYNKINQRCRLIEDDANTEPAQLKENPRKVYGDRAAVVSDASLMGACLDHDCPKYTSCVRLKSGSRVCVVSACGPTPEVQFPVSADDISGTMSAVGVTRYLPCDPGYIGSKAVVCLASGYWSEPEDHCTDCGNPPSVSNAVVSNGDTTIGSNRIYECSPATSASGSGGITCQQNGNWSVSSLVCIPDCGSPPSVSNAVVSNGDTTMGSTRIYECSPATSASGSVDITCQQDGAWSTPSFVCVPDCVVAKTMQNAHTSATVAPAGTTISYTCDAGFLPVYGTGARHCSSQGAWESLDLICFLISR